MKFARASAGDFTSIGRVKFVSIGGSGAKLSAAFDGDGKRNGKYVMPVTEAAHFSAQLPLLPRGTFYEGWRPSATRTTGATGASRFVVRDLKAGIDKKLVPTALHTKFFREGLLALGFYNAEAARALKYPLPHIQTASIGNPEAVTFTLAMEKDRLHGDFRAYRAERQ